MGKMKRLWYSMVGKFIRLLNATVFRGYKTMYGTSTPRYLER